MARATTSFSSAFTPTRHLVLELQRPDGTWHQEPLAGVFETHDDAVRMAIAIGPDWTIPSWVRIAEVLQ